MVYKMGIHYTKIRSLVMSQTVLGIGDSGGNNTEKSWLWGASNFVGFAHITHSLFHSFSKKKQRRGLESKAEATETVLFEGVCLNYQKSILSPGSTCFQK